MSLLRAVTTVLIALCVGPAFAETDGKIDDKSSFIAMVDGRELRISLYDLSLFVLPDGTIRGSALGWDVTGTWQWEDGYFCRTMDWSGYDIEYNCQMVEVTASKKLRFTTDRGTGSSASFSLR